MDIAITIPKNIPWEEYRKELDAAATGDMLNYRLGHLKPKHLNPGDRCYVVYDGMIRGYHIVSDVPWMNYLVCHTTGKVWLAGYYVQRTGKFHEIEPVKKAGFRGFRYMRKQLEET